MASRRFEMNSMGRVLQRGVTLRDVTPAGEEDQDGPRPALIVEPAQGTRSHANGVDSCAAQGSVSRETWA